MKEDYLDPYNDPETAQIIKCLSCINCQPVRERGNGMCKLDQCNFKESDGIVEKE